MKRNNRRILKKVIIAIAILAIAGGIFAYIYLKTDTLKTGKQLFAKYLIQNVTEASEIMPVEKVIKLVNELSTKKYEEEMTISYAKQEKQQPSTLITMKTQVDPVNKKTYASITLAEDELTEPIKAEFAQNSETYSLRFTDNVKQFLSIENSNLKQLGKNMGIDEEIINIIPDKINFDIISLEKLKFTEDEKNKELAKYAMILFNSISSENYSKNKDTVITVNGRTLTTNSYSLTLSRQNIKEIAIKVLEEIKQDNIILGKMQTLDEMLQDFEIESLKETFIKTIEENINNLKEKTVEGSNVKIIIYEENGKTVRIKLEKELDYITIDTTEVDGKEQIEINYVSMDEINTLTSKGIKIIKENDNKISIKIEEVEGEEQYTTNLQIELTENENNTKINIYQENPEGKLLINRDIKFLNEIKFEVALDNSNNITLNPLTEERITSIFNQLEVMVNEKYIKPLEKIDKGILYPVLLAMPLQLGDIPALLPIAAGITVYNTAKETIENVDFTEAERNLFNTKFELYQGENVSGTAVNSLLVTVILNNIGEKNLGTERYVTVSGVTTINPEDTTGTKVDISKNYKVECVLNENQLVNKIIITEAGI